MPTALIGGARGLKGNRHIAAPMGTPFSNLLLSLVNHAGIESESFGDSTARFDLDDVPQPPTSKG